MNTNPFALLGIDEEADDAAVRQAYLRRVRESPPDRDPERFQTVRAAYEQIATPRQRLAYRVFQPPVADLPALAAALLMEGQPRRPEATEVLALLTESLKGYRLPKSTEGTP